MTKRGRRFPRTGMSHNELFTPVETLLPIGKQKQRNCLYCDRVFVSKHVAHPFSCSYCHLNRDERIDEDSLSEYSNLSVVNHKPKSPMHD